MRGYRIARGIELLPGGAALLTEDNVMVIADLHLGCEAALEEDGLSMPRVQTRKIASHVTELIEEFSPSALVVAGDLKHNFSRNLVQEWQDVTQFVKRLGSRTRLEVVRGNHDNYLGLILRDIGVSIRNEIHFGDMRVIHGHEGRTTDEVTVMGHLHPSLRLKDSIGASVKDPCFLYNRGQRTLILPAQSIVFPGTDVVGQSSSDRMSPLLIDSGLAEFVPVAFSGRKALRFPSIGLMRRTRSSA